MDDNDDRRSRRTPRRGVRIIGAEEAAAALETGEAAGRRPLDEPRYGDVPRQPEGPRPAHRFPLPESVEPTSAVGPPARLHDRKGGIPASGSVGPQSRTVSEPADDMYEETRSEWLEDAPGPPRSRPRRPSLDDAELAEAKPGGWPAGGDDRWLEESHERWPEEAWEEPGASGAGDAEPDYRDWFDDTRTEPGGVSDALDMQHWAEPPTGEVPQVLLTEREGEYEDEMAAWASLPSRKASWRDEFDDWEQADYEPAMLADEETRVGALDPSGPDRPDLFTFDLADRDREEPADFLEDSPEPSPRRTRHRPRRARIPARPRGRAQGSAREPEGKDLRAAVLTGVGFAVVALVLFKLGPVTALALSVALVTLAAAEAYAVLRRAGYQPATLLGLAATVSVIVAAYLKGQEAIPLALALTVVFGLLWYMFGVVKTRPTINFSVTMGAFVWVGLLGSFAGLLLDPHAFGNRHGVAFLGGAVIATIAYDVGGYVVGHFGSHRLAPSISPRKTWEGLAGGMVSSIVFSIAIVGHIHPWTTGRAAALGLVVAVAAPLGDLCQSMIKRDLGVKDMGTALPGHGGILDRVDAMLFVLPATYYLVRLLNIG